MDADMEQKLYYQILRKKAKVECENQELQRDLGRKWHDERMANLRLEAEYTRGCIRREEENCAAYLKTEASRKAYWDMVKEKKIRPQ